MMVLNGKIFRNGFYLDYLIVYDSDEPWCVFDAPSHVRAVRTLPDKFIFNRKYYDVCCAHWNHAYVLIQCTVSARALFVVVN